MFLNFYYIAEYFDMYFSLKAVSSKVILHTKLSYRIALQK